MSVDETLNATHLLKSLVQRVNDWSRSRLAGIPTVSRLMPVAWSLTDQMLAVGATFLVNVVLARTQTKEEYGTFALSYSLFTFLAGLHNAAILEPYTVYGSGRYRERFPEYLRFMVRSNAIIGLLLTGLLLLTCLLFLWVAPQIVSRALLGLGLTVGVLLSGAFLRRVFYLQRQAAYAAKTSMVFFVTVVCGLWLMWEARLLDSLSVFLVLAVGWIAAGVCFGKDLWFGRPKQAFLELVPHYWREHWKYTQWVLATSFVFQFMTQGYYWLVAGFLSVKEVAELKAMYIVLAPVHQVFNAISLLALPALASRYSAERMGSFLSLWKWYGLAALGLTGLFALLVRILGIPVMHFLYAGKFDGVAPLLFVLALSPVLMGIGNTMNDALKAVERPRFVFYAYVCSGAATFLGGIPLVMHFGLRGAVYGMLFSGAVYTAALAAGFFFAVGREPIAVPGQ